MHYDAEVDRRGLAAVLASVVLVLAASFPWGDFQGHAHWNQVGWVPFGSAPLRARDVAFNLLLGAPVGASTASYFSRRHLIAAGLLAFAASLLGEGLQVYSHSRFPSATDVTSTTVGALTTAYLVTTKRARRQHA